MKLGIISDIHEDVISLNTVLRIFEEKKCDKLLCLGDILGYDPNFYPKVKIRNASECINLIRKNCEFAVVGNHDLFAIKKLPIQTNGFSYPSNWYELNIEERRQLSLSKLWLYENEFLENELSSDETQYISSLPEYLLLEIDSIIIHLSHSIYPDLTGSNFFRLHNPWELKTHFDWLNSKNAKYSFSGHMHSKYPLMATHDSIVEMPYRTHFVQKDIIQFVAPCVANGRGKSGIIIADIKNEEIEAIEINKLFESKIFSFYGRK